MLDFKKLSTFKENNRLEAKKATGGLPNSIWTTYSAFANTDGGIILLGVEEKADKSLKPARLSNPEKLITDFWNIIHNRNKVNVNILTNDNVEIVDVKGKKIIKITVPRASRTIRPIYLDNHPDNTYRRSGEGDYRCSKEEYVAMLRDNDVKTQDMLVLDKMDNSVFNYDTVKAYRNRLQLTRPDHVWENLPHDEFLFMLGAIGLNDNNERHPTAAGLLMFGNDHEIVREYGHYFLDYQEQFDMDTRWTDRVYSSTGEWSGNICDFYFKVINKLGQTLKVPFKLVGDTRIDDTPVHKAVREAVVNCLVNADYYGRCGLVIKRKLNKLTLENPGGFRVPLNLAISGGLSDPRNSVLMKMFNLLNIGERAGAGIPNIFHVWDKEKLGVPKYEEIMNGSRAKLTLPLEYTSSKQAETSSKRAVTLDNKGLIFSYLEENKKISASEAANLLKLSESRTRAILKEMTNAQKLEKIGSYRGAYYVIK
jgi:predicted HTH transcriptional regulator